MKIEYCPIGVVKTPFTTISNMPIQSSRAQGVRGEVLMEDEFAEGLRDLDGFSHIILLYHFHRVKDSRLVVTPFLDTQPRGVFSTRAPTRPNPVGLSVVKLLGIDGNVLEIENVDILDGTPLLDIKPYIPDFDARDAQRLGWFGDVGAKAEDVRSDERFGDEPHD